MAGANARHASLGCAPLTDGAAAGTWTVETDASGLHGGDLAVGLARMLLQSVPMGIPITTGWIGPLLKARPCKVKGLDPVVKRYRVRRDGGPGGSNATRASHQALIHAGWCVACLKRRRLRGVHPSRTVPPPAPGVGKRTRRVYTEGILQWLWPGCCSKVFLWAELT